MVEITGIDLIVTLALNLLSVVTSVALETDKIYSWWKDFDFKRVAWLAGAVILPGIFVGLVYLGAPIPVESGEFVWDGLVLWALSAYSMYYSGQATYTIQKAAGKNKEG
jgi:uncharacterized membrane protein YfcA